MLNVLSHCSLVLVNRLPPPPMPALLNNRWILSVACCSVISSRKRLSWSSMETSATCVVIRRPCGSLSTSQSLFVSAIASAETSHIATLQPSATSWRASSRPMPVPPPVMTAIFPAKSFMAHPRLCCGFASFTIGVSYRRVHIRPCVLGRPLALLQIKPRLLIGARAGICWVAEEDRRCRRVGHRTQLGNEYGVTLNAVLSFDQWCRGL